MRLRFVVKYGSVGKLTSVTAKRSTPRQQVNISFHQFCFFQFYQELFSVENVTVRYFYPYFQGFMEGRSLRVVYGFYFSQLFQEVPHGTKGTSPKFVTRPVYSRSQPQEQHEHRCCSSSTNVFISNSLYMVRRYCTSPGAPDLRARLG